VSKKKGNSVPWGLVLLVGFLGLGMAGVGVFAFRVLSERPSGGLSTPSPAAADLRGKDDARPASASPSGTPEVKTSSAQASPARAIPEPAPWKAA
jgi:hypothetical protein